MSRDGETRGANKGKTLTDCSCTGCGRPGKSTNPTHYRCGVCFYIARCRGLEARAAELEERAKKMREDAVEDHDRAMALYQKWGPPPK